MSRIVLGQSAGRNATLDVDALLRTRMLIQANSGKGKSWLLRRIAEQLFGKVQVILVDPEGEFATLREKFDYVLVGKGGETPADPRSAALVAQTLLKLRACAVCDLYEMKPFARHEWVQKFCEALIDAPKDLWHPCVVIVDEAHTFCPEKGAGESLASESIVALATRGRKRGFAPIFSTQRLGKFRKDAAAECLNVMIGGTFIDIDRKRAADALGVYGRDQHEFFDEIRLLERGHFFALGPAISDERIRIAVGPVETSHPEAGSARHAAEPPPAPDKVKALLPKLADLPKSAEEKAKTEAELRREIRELKAKLCAAPANAQESPAVDAKAIERAVLAASKGYQRQLKHLAVKFREIAAQSARLGNLASNAGLVADHSSLQGPHPYKVSGAEIQHERRSAGTKQRQEPAVSQPLPKILPPNGDDGDLTPYQREMLDALADLEAIGKTEPSWPLVGAAAGKSSGSSTFERYAARLRAAGFVDYPSAGRLRLTDEGRNRARRASEPLSPEEIQQRALALLTPYQQEILRTLIAAYPGALPIEELGARSGKAHDSSTFERYVAAMVKMEVIERPRARTAKASDWLFLEGAA